MRLNIFKLIHGIDTAEDHIDGTNEGLNRAIHQANMGYLTIFVIGLSLAIVIVVLSAMHII